MASIAAVGTRPGMMEAAPLVRALRARGLNVA